MEVPYVILIIFMIVISFLCLLDTMEAPKIWGGQGARNWGIWSAAWVVTVVAGVSYWSHNEKKGKTN